VAVASRPPYVEPKARPEEYGSLEATATLVASVWGFAVQRVGNPLGFE